MSQERDPYVLQARVMRLERENANLREAMKVRGMRLFTIRNKATGAVMGVSFRSNDPEADFCNSYSAEFDGPAGMSAVYCVADREVAEKALHNRGWYNSSSWYPEWPKSLNPDDWEVVELVVDSKS